jgi:uncharacterized membrane protein
MNMKTVLLLVAASLSFVVLVGCESSRGGGISGGEGFKIVTPVLGTKIRQGETQSVTISLNRGEYFKRDVTLDIRASKGITVVPTQAVVRASDRPDVHLQITAANDAALGEYKIFVQGTPQTGEATSTEFTVKVVSP